MTMLCATLRRRRRSLDSLEDYGLLAPSHRCSSCGRKYSRSKQILSKVRKLIRQTGTVLVADWLVDRVVFINRTYHLLLRCCHQTGCCLYASGKSSVLVEICLCFGVTCCLAQKMEAATPYEKLASFYSATRRHLQNLALSVSPPRAPQILCLSIFSNVGRYSGYPN